MGTGIVSILLHNLPYNGDWLYWISVIIFCLNIVLFVTFFLILVVRYTVYPEIWWAMIRNPAQSLFIGTFPMGLATIVNMIVFVCVPAWGYRFVQLVNWLYSPFGLMLTFAGMGSLVDRRSNISGMLLVHAIRHVCTYPSSLHTELISCPECMFIKPLSQQ
jgi:tellurite resistance protein TehA-like permease